MKKRVFIAIPVLLVGGTEMQTLMQVRALIDAGHKVTVCCYYENDAEMVFLMRHAGADIILMEQKRSEGYLSLISQLLKILKKDRPDIVHVQYIAPGFIPIVAARLAGIKTIFATVHQPGRTYGWMPHILLRIAASLSTAFFCNSRSVEESWFGSSQIFSPVMPDKKRGHYTIYNAVDVESIAGAAAMADVKALKAALGINGKSVIGVVGRLRAEKGHLFLIEAMPAVLAAIPETLLLVVGDGPDMEALKTLVKKLNLEKNIIWAGRKSSEEVNKLFAVMDVVVVPSVFEGFGLVAAEAMAAGKPVVASDVDGLAEVIEDGETGCLVPAGDSRLLATAIITLLENPGIAKSMGQKGYTRINEKFSLTNYRRDISNAYRILRGSDR